MNYAYKTLIVVFCVFFTEGGFAQTLFKAAAIVGVNLAQIDGDRQQGYRKPGVSLGLDGSIYIRPDLEISTQLLYNQKGSKPSPDATGGTINTIYSTFSLDYSEIALLLNYHFRPNGSRTYYLNSIYAGLSYGRLLKSSTTFIRNNQPYTTLENEVAGKYNPTDFSFMVGWTQLFTPRIGVGFRFTRSINYVYKNPNYRFTGGIDSDFDKMKPYFLSFHAFYNLVSPNKKMGLKSKKQKERSNPLEELY